MLSIRFVLASSIVVAALGGAGCYSSSSSPTTPSPVQPAAPPPAGASSVNIPVAAESLGSRAFIPGELDITAGTTVTWVNNDSVSHTSTSDVPGWNSGTIAAGRQFSFSFQTPGRFTYHCSIHPGMVGAVSVR